MIRPGQGFFAGDEADVREGDTTALDAAAPLAPGEIANAADPPAEPEPPRYSVRLVEPPLLPRVEPGAPEPPPGASRAGPGRAAWIAVAVVALGMAIGLGYGWRRSSGAEAGAPRTAYVNAFGLNVRAGPTRDHAIVATLLRGDPLSVLGDHDARDPRWVRVRVGDVEGWVNSDYLVDRLVPGALPPVPPASSTPVQPRITLQYQAPGDRGQVDAVQQALRSRPEWRVGEPEHVLPTAENRAEVYGGLRFYFESDLELARAVCGQVVAELARRGMTVTMPLWPMVTGQREGRFHASPGLIEVWISPLPAAASAPAPPGQCGR